MAGGRLGRVPWQVSFVVAASIWGCSFWWIKIGLEVLAPVQVAFTRTAIGALTLLLICAVTRTPLPRSRTTWRHLLVVAFLLNSIPATLFAFGETQVSSVLAGIINATTPLATLVVVLLAFPEEHPTREKIAGLLIGFIGVLVIIGVWQGLGSGEWLGVLACVGAITCYGIAFPYTRRNLSVLPDSRTSLATGQVLTGALILVPPALLAGPLHGPVQVETILAMLTLGALGTGVAYVLNYHVIDAAGGTTASTVTYLTPIVAVIVGGIFLGEHVTLNQPIGGAIALAGIALAQGRLRALARTATSRG
jgi:drug/metabolite transporter (DMT)-like permease